MSDDEATITDNNRLTLGSQNDGDGDNNRDGPGTPGDGPGTPGDGKKETVPIKVTFPTYKKEKLVLDDIDIDPEDIKKIQEAIKKAQEGGRKSRRRQRQRGNNNTQKQRGGRRRKSQKRNNNNKKTRQTKQSRNNLYQ